MTLADSTVHKPPCQLSSTSLQGGSPLQAGTCSSEHCQSFLPLVIGSAGYTGRPPCSHLWAATTSKPARDTTAGDREWSSVEGTLPPPATLVGRVAPPPRTMVGGTKEQDDQMRLLFDVIVNVASLPWDTSPGETNWKGLLRRVCKCAAFATRPDDIAHHSHLPTSLVKVSTMLHALNRGLVQNYECLIQMQITHMGACMIMESGRLTA